jgi:hypothetical protein
MYVCTYVRVYYYVVYNIMCIYVCIYVCNVRTYAYIYICTYVCVYIVICINLGVYTVYTYIYIPRSSEFKTSINPTLSVCSKKPLAVPVCHYVPHCLTCCQFQHSWLPPDRTHPVVFVHLIKHSISLATT